VERRWLVRFKSGDEQPIFATEGFEDEQCLIFLKADGSLAAFFDLREVAQWQAVGQDSVS
jgi:hypothetical protein